MKIYLSLLLSIINCSLASENQYLSWEKLQNNFSKYTRNPKALSHVKCFFEEHQNDTFQLKQPQNMEFFNRCFALPEISLESKRVFAIIDYTVDSNEQRMFLIDRLTGEISKMAVAHGRYNTGFFNLKPAENKNTIRKLKYYSNEINSMASSSGFFIAGQDHKGIKFGRSLVLHGLESGINDNACERDVVIHSHFLVSRSNVFMLSSGCPMVSPNYIDHVINLLRGVSDEEVRLVQGGSLVLIYGPREKKWRDNSCPGLFNPANKKGLSYDRP